VFSPLPDSVPVPPILISSFVPAAQLAFVQCVPSGSGDWQTAPCRQFLFLLAGENETEVSDGEVRCFGRGSITFVEATTGKGQATCVVGTKEYLEYFNLLYTFDL
jgi:hypothetical protein